tara:strand:+ start:127 stop:327 length:201 start_codon:yes stop_codon:yes gene_type:complete
MQDPAGVFRFRVLKCRGTMPSAGSGPSASNRGGQGLSGINRTKDDDSGNENDKLLNKNIFLFETRR